MPPSASGTLARTVRQLTSLFPTIRASRLLQTIKSTLLSFTLTTPKSTKGAPTSTLARFVSASFIVISANWMFGRFCALLPRFKFHLHLLAPLLRPLFPPPLSLLPLVLPPCQRLPVTTKTTKTSHSATSFKMFLHRTFLPNLYLSF